MRGAMATPQLRCCNTRGKHTFVTFSRLDLGRSKLGSDSFISGMETISGRERENFTTPGRDPNRMLKLPGQ